MTINFRKMIYLLIFIMVGLSVAIVCLSIDFKRTKSSHEAKVGQLKYAINQLTARNDSQIGQLQLAADVAEKLETTRRIIDENLLAIQYDCIAILSKNNLVV